MIDKKTQLERDAREIFNRALGGVSPERLMDRALSQYDLVHEVGSSRRTVLIACGKAACPMAARLLDHVSVTEGVVTIPHGGYCRLPQGIEVNTSAHPIPDAASAEAARSALALAESLDDGDLAVVLISGGGSSLWAGVPEDLRLEHKQATVSRLLLSGAPIEEINTVRKHLSTIKGGRLAQAVHPGRCVSLVISDVVGNSLSVIASGPTVGDVSTFDDAIAVLEGRGGSQQYPVEVVERLSRGSRGDAPETPRPEDPVFAQSLALLIGSNRDALDEAAQAAADLGYEVRRSLEAVTGDAADAGRRLALEMVRTPVNHPTCFLWGGETTVTVQGRGTGGRNQELALAAAVALDRAGISAVLLSGGTDGIDGPTDAAGAVVSPFTVSSGMRAGCRADDFLSDNDSYSFFARMGGHVVTGPTGTNVMDIQIGLSVPPGLDTPDQR